MSNESALYTFLLATNINFGRISYDYHLRDKCKKLTSLELIVRTM